MTYFKLLIFNAEMKTIDFDGVKAGLEAKNIVYVDVRNRSELANDGKIVGSVNLPCIKLLNFTSL